MLKKSARKRGLPFTITLEYFKELVSQTDYMEKKGRKEGSLNIDRIDGSKGYEPGNLQVIEKEENLFKYYAVEKPLKDCPF